MNKIDRRHHYYLAVDTETCGGLGKPYVYDLGVKVIDSKGNTYEAFSWVLYEVYVGMKDLMATAFYADKLPQYEQGIGRDWKMVKVKTAFGKVRDLMRDYGITEILAYNTRFDLRALNNTLRYATNYKWFFPYGTEYLDIWNMACSTLFQRKAFLKMAHANNWESDKGNLRTNAEVGYAFISNSTEFKESHTALADVEIETEIFFACLKARVKQEDRKMIGNPWQKPQPKWKEYKLKATAKAK